VSTREKILETASRLFSTRGYAATSLAQVARTAHVSKALILWYFDSKEQLFQAALQHFLAPYEIDAHALLGLNEYEQIEKLIDDYYDFVAEHLSSVKFVLGQVVRDDENSQELIVRVSELYRMYCGLLTSILGRGCERHVFPPHLKPAQEATLILATLNGLLLQRLVEHEDGPGMRDLRMHFKQTVRARLFCSSPRGGVTPAILAGTPAHAPSTLKSELPRRATGNP
jgi:AcrR family transcriptional regulator